MKRTIRLLALVTALLLLIGLPPALGEAQTIAVNAAEYPVSEDGEYATLKEVAAYLDAFGRLPANFITKKKAQALGWDSREGNLWQVAPGKSIGGDRFGNYEGLLPAEEGRTWTECDIDFDGGYRNGKRIVFSSDGLIYYTDDHYQSFRPVEVTRGDTETAEPSAVTQDGAYTARDDVAAYLRLYGKLPGNYLTRKQAGALGWDSRKDNLGDVAPGCAIGGDRFGNREGLLPDADGRQWYECDVNVQNGKRSGERLVWSSDGLIYYTPDNHKSFERLE